VIDISIGQYNLVYNAFSFTIAMMGAATSRYYSPARSCSLLKHSFFA